MRCQTPWSRMPHKAVAEALTIARAGQCRDTVDTEGEPGGSSCLRPPEEPKVTPFGRLRLFGVIRVGQVPA